MWTISEIKEVEDKKFKQANKNAYKTSNKISNNAYKTSNKEKVCIEMSYVTINRNRHEGGNQN